MYVNLEMVAFGKPVACTSSLLLSMGLCGVKHRMISSPRASVVANCRSSLVSSKMGAAKWLSFAGVVMTFNRLSKWNASMNSRNESPPIGFAYQAHGQHIETRRLAAASAA